VTNRLGFGCAHLYGGRSRAGSLRLLDAAIDAGVTYFDTARLYGHGEAESLLGIAASGRRDRLFITSKAGILPTWNPPSRRIRDRAVRIMRSVPSLRPLLVEPETPQPTFGAFAPSQIEASVRVSLRALKTEYLDLLLLHECAPGHASDPAVLDLLARLREQGLIRAWGVATDVAATLAILGGAAADLATAQFAHSAFEPTLERVRAVSRLPLVLHSVLGSRFASLVAALKTDPGLRADLSDGGIDPDDASGIAVLLLAAAMQANPEGVVLFSATRTDHITANQKAHHAPPEAVASVLRGLHRFMANSAPA
jgi:aryl-alcohol dehydrogenase-like predicted oxidoreductase